MCWRPQLRDRVALGADVVHGDIVEVVLLNFRRQVDGDLDLVIEILLLDRLQERVEPLGGAKVANDPGEVDL